MAKEPTKKAAKKAVKTTVTKKVVAKKAAAKKAAPKTKAAAPAAPVKRATPVKKVAASAKTATPAPKPTPAPAKPAPAKKAAVKKAAVKKAAPKKAARKLTTIVAKIDVGFGNGLSLRGEGAGLSWDKGVVMGCAGPDEWVWSSDAVKGSLEFKMLINDDVWAEGANRIVKAGERIVVEPTF